MADGWPGRPLGPATRVLCCRAPEEAARQVELAALRRGVPVATWIRAAIWSALRDQGLAGDWEDPDAPLGDGAPRQYVPYRP